jgi:hypothetical protein
MVHIRTVTSARLYTRMHVGSLMRCKHSSMLNAHQQTVRQSVPSYTSVSTHKCATYVCYVLTHKYKFAHASALSAQHTVTGQCSCASSITCSVSAFKYVLITVRLFAFFSASAVCDAVRALQVYTQYRHMKILLHRISSMLPLYGTAEV